MSRISATHLPVSMNIGRSRASGGTVIGSWIAATIVRTFVTWTISNLPICTRLIRAPISAAWFSVNSSGTTVSILYPCAFFIACGVKPERDTSTRWSVGKE